MLGLKPIKMLPARERVAAALRKAIISGSGTWRIDHSGQRSLSDSGKRRADRSEAE